MKLYNVPNGSWVQFKIQEDNKGSVKIPLAHRELKPAECVFFDHIDGMYSFCLDGYGEIVHPACWTEVTVVEGHEFLRNLITWGSYGKDGTEKQQIRFVRDLSDTHIPAILKNISRISPDIKKCLEEEIEYRKENDIKVANY